MKKLFVFPVILILILGALTNVYASQSSAAVTLPNFKITLNGTQIDNTYREYPFITYKGITYFPLTYFDCRFLGIETIWNQSTGLEVNKTGITCGYRNSSVKIKNKNSYTATIPNFKIKINGKTIDNVKEEYPLLLFKNVTYFPMTWRFCVNEFGWSYKFDNINGLSVNSTNPTVSNIVSSKFSGYNLEYSFLLDDEACYYLGEKGEIYKLSYANNAKPEKIFQLPSWSYGDGAVYVTPRFYKDNDKPCFSFHQGGAIMGSDWYYLINPDGTVKELESGYLYFKSFGDYQIKISQYFPPSPDNMIIKKGNSEFTSVGNPKYCYGIAGNFGGCGPSNNLYMVDENIYVLGMNSDYETEYSKVVKVNINTNETTELGSTPTDYFVLDNNNIYREDFEVNLYKIDLKTNIETAIDIPKYNDFEVLNDKIYYWNSADNKLYCYGQNKAVNENGKLTSMEMDDSYLVCKFEETSTNPYRLIIIDKNGDIVLKSSDVARYTDISGDVLTYMEFYSKDIYRVSLK